MHQFSNNKKLWVYCFIYSILILNVNQVNGDDDGWWGYAKTAAGYTVGGAVATVVAGPILGVMGFTSAGIAAGSIAAGLQASMGTVASGSAFAALQSAGAAGLGIAGKALVAGGGALVGEKILSAVSNEKQKSKK